jgi:hypothetical protein
VIDGSGTPVRDVLLESGRPTPPGAITIPTTVSTKSSIRLSRLGAQLLGLYLRHLAL